MDSSLRDVGDLDAVVAAEECGLRACTFRLRSEITAQSDIQVFPGSIPSVFGTHRPETAHTTAESLRDGFMPHASGPRDISRTFFTPAPPQTPATIPALINRVGAQPIEQAVVVQGVALVKVQEEMLRFCIARR